MQQQQHYFMSATIMFCFENSCLIHIKEMSDTAAYVFSGSVEEQQQPNFWKLVDTFMRKEASKEVIQTCKTTDFKTFLWGPVRTLLSNMIHYR